MWKQQLRTTTSNPTIDLDIEPTPKRKKTNCLSKLKEMVDKVENYNLLLRERWELGWPEHSEYFQPLEPNANKGLFVVNLKDKYRWGGTKPDWETWDFYEEKETTFTEIPEDIACEALRILETHEQTNLPYNSFKRYTYNNWAIIRDYNFDYQRNINYLRIDNPSGATPIVIKWENGEDLSGIYEEGSARGIDVVRSSANIYRISGYYDARDFGFNWHK